MKTDELMGQYFGWLCSKVECPAEYSKLMSYLFDKTFVYTIGMDANRAEDGIDLRYTFGEEDDIDSRIISSVIDDRPCSMLEMMVALAIRCETHIMSNSEYGDRTSEWFRGMIDNLGLSGMTDDCFDHRQAEKAIDRLLTHRYAKNGAGGLFTVKSRSHDMRTAEIWYQMCWYLDTVI